MKHMQAGLNLNVVGALKGAFSSKSKKETEADGSSTEHREEQAKVKGKMKPHILVLSVRLCS